MKKVTPRLDLQIPQDAEQIRQSLQFNPQVSGLSKQKSNKPPILIENNDGTFNERDLDAQLLGPDKYENQDPNPYNLADS